MNESKDSRGKKMQLKCHALIKMDKYHSDTSFSIKMSCVDSHTAAAAILKHSILKMVLTHVPTAGKLRKQTAYFYHP